MSGSNFYHTRPLLGRGVGNLKENQIYNNLGRDQVLANFK